MKNLFDLSGKKSPAHRRYGCSRNGYGARTLEAGAQVALLSRNPDNLKSAAEELGGDAGAVLLLKGDVTDTASLERAREELLETWGELDILVNAAGGNRAGATIGPDQTFFDLNMEDFAGVSKLNLDGTVIPSLVFGKLMVEGRGGSIVNISSMAADRTITRWWGTVPQRRASTISPSGWPSRWPRSLKEGCGSMPLPPASSSVNRTAVYYLKRMGH